MLEYVAICLPNKTVVKRDKGTMAWLPQLTINALPSAEDKSGTPETANVSSHAAESSSESEKQPAPGSGHRSPATAFCCQPSPRKAIGVCTKSRATPSRAATRPLAQPASPARAAACPRRDSATRPARVTRACCCLPPARLAHSPSPRHPSVLLPAPGETWRDSAPHGRSPSGASRVVSGAAGSLHERVTNEAMERTQLR